MGKEKVKLDHFLNEDYDLAIAEYTAMLEIDANCLEALKWRARAYHCIGNLEKEFEDWETISRIDPDFALEEMPEIAEWLVSWFKTEIRGEIIKRVGWDSKSQGLPF